MREEWPIPGNRFIRTRCAGAVTVGEVTDHFRVLERDPDCPDQLDVLLDLSEVTSIPDHPENLRDVTRAISRIRGRVRFGACAIVACTDVLFGMLRMFEVFAEQRFRVSCVFRTASQAEVWLSQLLRFPPQSKATQPSFLLNLLRKVLRECRLT